MVWSGKEYVKDGPTEPWTVGYYNGESSYPWEAVASDEIFEERKIEVGPKIEVPEYKWRFPLRKIRSGGQCGADLAGLHVGQSFGYKTGGVMPKGFITLEGPKPEYAERYGVTEHSSSKYAPRTYENARDSDGTLRFASNFNSPGEICTERAISCYNKPFLDINITNALPIETVINWIIEKNIKVLNIAGNSENISPGIFNFVVDYMSELFTVIARL